MLEIHFQPWALWVSGQSIDPCIEGSQVLFPIKGMYLGWRFHPQPCSKCVGKATDPGFSLTLIVFLSPLHLKKEIDGKNPQVRKKKCFKKHDAIGGLKKTSPPLFGIGIYLSVYLPPYITLYHSNYIFFS